MSRPAADYTRLYPCPAVLPHRNVSWHGDNGVWTAEVRAEGRRHHLGRFVRHADAVAAVEAIRPTLPGQGVRGRTMRRYPAPPGMRACANPDCTHGPDGSRYVGPEAAFPRAGKHRKSYCRLCGNAASAEWKRRQYDREAERILARCAAARQERQAKARQERRENARAARRAARVLAAAGWTTDRLAAAIGVDASTLRRWKHGHADPVRKPDSFVALVRLAAGVAKEARP